jgi:hypothetical protein
MNSAQLPWAAFETYSRSRIWTDVLTSDRSKRELPEKHTEDAAKQLQKNRASDRRNCLMRTL